MTASSNTVILISGANQGLGFECVKKLAAENSDYQIILCSRHLGRGRQAASIVTDLAKGTTVEALELDVDDDESIADAAKYFGENYGRLDVLLNNVGIMTLPNASSFRVGMTGVIQTNAVSTACVAEALLPLMRKSSTPRIVLMSSGWGSITRCLDTSQSYYGYDAKPYFTSKAAMNMIGAQYAVQLGKEDFKVNIVSPDFRSTNLNGFHEYGGDPRGGAIEACKAMVDIGKDGPNGTFTELDGIVPW